MPGVTQKYIYFYVHSQPLSIGTVELVDDSDRELASVEKPPTSPQAKRRNQIGSNTLWQSVLMVATELALRLVSWT